MKKIITLYISLMFAFAVPPAFAASCDTEGIDGVWKEIKTRSWNFYYLNPWSDDKSCWVSGSGTFVAGNPDNNLTYQVISGDRKMEETVRKYNSFRNCSPPYGCWDDGPGGSSACCDGPCGSVLDSSPQTPGYPIWPPCITELKTALSTITEGKCTRDICSGGRTAVTCRSMGYGSCAQGYNSCYCYGWSVVNRKDYQWVCNTCTAAYNILATECGGQKNITFWDNDGCTGFCDEPARQNLGPPPTCEPEK